MASEQAPLNLQLVKEVLNRLGSDPHNMCSYEHIKPNRSAIMEGSGEVR